MYDPKVTIEEYIEASDMDQDGACSTTVEMLVLAHDRITQYGSTVYIGIAMGGPAL